MAAIDPTTPYVAQLKGTGLSLFAVSVAGCVLSTIVVVLRTWVRLSSQAFGLDDGLMLGGLAIYIVDVGLGCEGARAGLGTLDVELSAKMQVDSRKWLMLWMMLYTCGLCLIKSSICITMLRIAQSMRYFRFAVYVLLVLTIATWVTTFVGILCLCRPVAANWDASLVMSGRAKCATMDAMIALSYTSTASTILTDLACAVLPAFLLWDMQMALRAKILVGVLLSFASLASISTMVRTPYIEYYRNPTDNLPYHIGNIVLWSNIETAIGLIAGSLPSLRIMLKRSLSTHGPSNDGEISSPSKNKDLVTIGGSSMTGGKKSKGRGFKNPTDVGVTVSSVYTHGEGDWRRLRDSNAQWPSDDKCSVPSRGIRADYTYEVELDERPVLSKSDSSI